MPNSAASGGTRRGGPTFKFYWVENGRIVDIKRYDEAEPAVVPYRIFKLISFVFPHFKLGEHVVKFQDDNDLIELTEEDCVRFNAESGDLQVYMYIFSSKEEASRTVTASALLPSNTPRVEASSLSTQTFTTPVAAAPQQVQMTVPQPQLAAVPQLQVEVTQQKQPDQPEVTQQKANPENSNSSNQGPSQEAGDSDNRHLHVVCDGCNGNIPTHRYKCMQCLDYDLCASCESKGLHPEHLMVRVPLHFVQVYGEAHREILSRILSCASREFSDDVVIDLGKQLKEVLKAFGIELDHIGEGKHCGEGRRRHGHGGHDKGKHCPFSPFGYPNKRSDSKHHSSKKSQRREMKEEARASHAMDTQSGPPPSAPSAPFAPPTNEPSPPAPFDPTPTLIPNPAHPGQVSTQAIVPPSAPAQMTEEAAALYPELGSVEVVPMDEDSPRAGEWLMIDSDGAAIASSVERPTQRQPDTTLPFLHSDDLVNVALEKLAMMGYRIDDPALVGVVEQCKGDIRRILDCLHG